MIRRMVVIAAAIALPVSVVAATGSMAGAGAPKVDATHNTVTCTGLTGTVKFSPPVTQNESAGTETTSIKATLTGCTSNATGLSVFSGSAKGSISSTHAAGTNGCTALAGTNTENGTLTTKWKSSPKLSSGSSVVTVHSVGGSIGMNGNATFQIPGSGGTPSSGTGSFSGNDNGASDATNAQTTTSAASILATCQSAKGLKSLGVQSPQSGPAVSLG